MVKCCICGTVRNCGMFLDNIFKIMEKIGSIFEDYRIILYYDTSNDNTLNKLQNYSVLNNKMQYIVNMDKMLKYRTYRISKGRNKCLEIIRNEYPDYEYFIMMDCDDKCNYNINISLLKMYLNRHNWDSLSFNHPTGYYDTWALSKRPYVISCHHFRDISAGQRFINKLIQITPKNKLIRCLSAFNGFSIYRTHKFKDCWYDGRFRLNYIPKKLITENIIANGKLINKTPEDCEHRFFHFSAVKKHNAKIMISPLCLFFR
jgi:hypothetical protein